MNQSYTSEKDVKFSKFLSLCLDIMVEKLSDDKSTLLWNPLLAVLVVDKSHTKPGLIAFRPLKIAKGRMSVKFMPFFYTRPCSGLTPSNSMPYTSSRLHRRSPQRRPSLRRSLDSIVL